MVDFGDSFSLQDKERTLYIFIQKKNILDVFFYKEQSLDLQIIKHQMVVTLVREGGISSEFLKVSEMFLNVRAIGRYLKGQGYTELTFTHTYSLEKKELNTYPSNQEMYQINIDINQTSRMVKFYYRKNGGNQLKKGHP